MGFAGRFATAADYSQLLRTNCRVLREDGSLLLVLLKSAISKPAGAAMYQAIRKNIYETNNRGTASGQEFQFRKKKDGTLSKTHMTAGKVYSSLMGFYDRYPRIPYCRQTSFNEKNPEKFLRCLPALQEADAAFKAHAPENYANQKAVAAATHADFLIPKTTFTTVTLNRNFRTAYHMDAGDLPDGFGVMSVYRSGRFGGMALVFPAYRVAVQLDSFDLLLFDPHEYHGNTACIAPQEGWERITCVHYYRKGMRYCGSADDELELARRHDPRKEKRKMSGTPP